MRGLEACGRARLIAWRTGGEGEGEGGQEGGEGEGQGGASRAWLRAPPAPDAGHAAQAKAAEKARDCRVAGSTTFGAPLLTPAQAVKDKEKAEKKAEKEKAKEARSREF